MRAYMALDECMNWKRKSHLRIIRERSGLSTQHAYALRTIACRPQVTQMVDGNKGVHCVLIPHALIAPSPG